MEEVVKSLKSRPTAAAAAAASHRSANARPLGEGDLAIEQLFCDCEGRLGRFLAQMVGNRQLAEVENREAWLFGIARNRALSALRSRRRFRAALERLVQRPEPSERDDLELLALRDLLERHLEPDDRALLILRYLYGFDSGELAAMTGRTPEAVRQR